MSRWPIKKLGIICSAVNERANEGIVPYLEIGNLNIETKEYELTDKPAVKGALISKEGDVIVSRVRPTRGAIALLRDKQLAISSAFTILRSKNELLSNFLYFALAWNNEFLTYLGRRSKGALYPTVPEKDVLSFEIPLPPIPEQERIVKLLDEANELRKLRTQSDNRIAALIPALFHEMFGDPATNEMKWPVVQLRDVISRITNGYVGPTRDIYQESGIPYILSRHVHNNILRFDGKTFISPSFNQRNAKSILKTGDVLLVQTGHVGEAAVVSAAHKGHNCHAIIVMTPLSEKLVGEYLSFWLTSSSGRLLTAGIQTGATLKHLNCGDVKKLQIMLPPIALQKEFTARVEEIRKIENTQSIICQRLGCLFQSLLHGVFKGEL